MQDHRSPDDWLSRNTLLIETLADTTRTLRPMLLPPGGAVGQYTRSSLFTHNEYTLVSRLKDSDIPCQITAAVTVLTPSLEVLSLSNLHWQKLSDSVMAGRSSSTLSIMALLLAAALVPASYAEGPIAYWTNPRAAFVRNQIFIEGGDKFDGDNTTASRTPSAGGSLYEISLCKDFSTDGTGSDPFPFLNKINNLTAQSTPPYFVGGAMYANDEEFYTYGLVCCTLNPAKC